MRLSQTLVAAATFAAVAAACFGGAVVAVNVIEARSESAVDRALFAAGHDWAEVDADGLRLVLTGTAASEADRFAALTSAGKVADSTRLVDAMRVAAPAPVEPPRFSVELLRNEDGVSAIGLVPAPDEAGREALMGRIRARAAGLEVTDMIEAANHPAPPTWASALAFGLEALEMLPRARISIAADRIEVTAISDSAAEKRRLEAELARRVPEGVRLVHDISAPRPVITPFTLRFIIDPAGARFDACAADNERGRARILAAARAAGAPASAGCTLALGVPSPTWAEATSTAIAALAELGAGAVTFSDADVSLVVPAHVPGEAFDRVAGDLKARLPEVFSLSAVQEEPPAAPTTPESGAPTFTATLSPEGMVQLRGRLPDDLVREAVDSFARAHFGAAAVYTATRNDPDLPEGWPVRALAGLEALAELENGALLMRADRLELRGVSGNPEVSDVVSRILSSRLGQGQAFAIDVRYDEALDPAAALPTPQECVARVNAALSANKITFAPGSAEIDADAARTLDAVAEVLRDCPDVPMEIGGHTDSQGRAAMNLDLSQQRADAVLAGLMARRVLVGSLTARGYGAERPVADNDTEAGREANRRIEVRLLVPEDEAPADAVGEGAEAPAEGAAAADALAAAGADGDVAAAGADGDATLAGADGDVAAAGADGGAAPVAPDAVPPPRPGAEPATVAENDASTAADGAAPPDDAPDGAAHGAADGASPDEGEPPADVPAAAAAPDGPPAATAEGPPADAAPAAAPAVAPAGADTPRPRARPAQTGDASP